MLKNEDDVIEQVPGFNIQKQRRIAVLLENYCRRYTGLQTMRFIPLDDFAEGAHGAAATLPVIRHCGEPMLDLSGGVKTLN